MKVWQHILPRRSKTKYQPSFEVLEDRSVRIEIMRGGIVQVGGEPQCVANAGASHERQQVCDLNAASERRPGAGRGGGNRSEGGIRSDHFPGC